MKISSELDFEVSHIRDMHLSSTAAHTAWQILVFTLTIVGSLMLPVSGTVRVV
jgi:hypothetical protein